ncbi:MAG: helix-hairpin-helix domain-containing protein [Gammaproteobacteria bacterium]|nr:helix-hairpin-helix domain-containing protein [Gammaproteobacteria bacterium]
MTDFNHGVADNLRIIAGLLQAQRASPIQPRAYYNAADSLEQLAVDVRKILQQGGIKSLSDLPSIDDDIAQSVYEYVATGQMTTRQTLQASRDPVALFQAMPAVGKTLAKRIHDTLQVDSLEALESATCENQLCRVAGLGPKRQQAIEAWLATQLDDYQAQQHGIEEPAIDLLIKIDAEYRQKAGAGKLTLITPKRFNPERKAWLPVLHSRHHHWYFTALYSNTARAHKLKQVYDWVLIYCYNAQQQQTVHTLVTETHGALTGRRVVRGKEAECLEYYDRQHQCRL